MTTNYPITTEQLYEATNKGLDIYTKYLQLPVGAENGKIKFKYRESEASPSSVLSLKNGIYFLVDFGGESFSPVSMMMDKFGLEFGPAFKKLCDEFNLSPNNTFYKPEKEFKDTDLPLEHFDIQFKNFQSLDQIGRFVNTENIDLDGYHFYEVDYYEKVIVSSKTNQSTLLRVTATKDYPIFCYTPDVKVWGKLYEPKATKNQKGFSSKHSYFGTKPKRYVHGLQRILDSVDVDYIKEVRERIRTEKSKSVREAYEEELEELLLDEIFICTGGSDGLNLASLGYDVIWFNSESEQISYEEYVLLRTIAKNVYNLPDIDKSGMKYGKEVAENFWDLKSIWLSKDKMTANGKDFRDWLAFYRSSDKNAIKGFFENLKTGALKCKFFDKKTAKTGAPTYKINLSNLHYFLNVKNFYTYKIEHKNLDIATEDQIIFITILGNVVSKVSPREIRKYCENYLKDKGQKLEVINMIKSSPYFNENHLLSLDNIGLDFKNFDAETQYFFFANQVAKITKDSIELKKHGQAENFSWDKSVIKHTILKEDPFFEYYKDESGNDRIKILRQDCEFQNYLINGSRIYWRKDLEEPFKNQQEKEKYHNENRFNLNGENLDEAHHLVQEKHYLNKCYALGYMLHKYKQEDYAKMLYIMDDTVKESEEDANGRSGKSLMLRGLRCLLPQRFLIDGKNKSVTTDKHIFHGLDENAGFIEVEDMDKYMDFKFFYTKITTGVVVNPKQTKPFELDFEEVPKWALTTNYGLANIKGSDIGRLLFVSFSDYYHEKTENYLEQRKVSQDFNNKAFFQTWSDKQYNIFYNFLMQCCLFYLQNRSHEFQAPQDNITINNLKAGIGDGFMEWANSYFLEENLNVKINKHELRDNYVHVIGAKSAKSVQEFRKSLQSYCKLRGWIFNPAEQQRKDGRIVINSHDHNGKKTTIECFYIKADETEAPAEPTAQQLQPEMSFETVKTDLPDWL
jgi:hypothetical protein